MGGAGATGEEERATERYVYGGGADPNGVTNVGGDDSGARPMVAEGVALRETCAGKTTNECRDSHGGATEPDCGKTPTRGPTAA